MAFLQPWLLLGLPAIALPIVIHLLNQRRHQTVPWAASAFVKQVSRSNRGNAIVRHWMILFLRMMAIAAVIFAISRPLATSFSGLSVLGTGRPQLILVDRSPSMAFRDSATGLTVRESLLGQLDVLLEQTHSRCTRRLIEPVRWMAAPTGDHDLVSLPDTEVVADSTDIPALVEASLDCIETDTLGPTDIWVCSDMQAADWNLASGRWNRIRQRIEGLPGTRIRVLSPQAAQGFNLAVSVSNVTGKQDQQQFILEMDITIKQTHGDLDRRTVPVVIRVAGIERRLDAELVAGRFDATRVRVELPSEGRSDGQGSGEEKKGGGMIEIPTDANDADNRCFFSYAPPAPRRTVVVSDDEDVRALVELVSTTEQTEGVAYQCDRLPVRRRNDVNWAKASLVVWHAELPTGDMADKIHQFVESGRRILFLPPERNAQRDTQDNSASLFDVRWKQWESVESNAAGSNGFRVTSWRRDGDLLATEIDGRVLPVDELICQRRRLLQSGSATTLAGFADGTPLLVRGATDVGGAYFLAALPTAQDANFVDDGIVLFVMLHRCLSAGAIAGGQAQQVQAGQLADADTRDWIPLDTISAAVPPSERPFHAGMYTVGDRVLAIDRPTTEDDPEVLDGAAIREVLGINSFDRVAAETTNISRLASEIWKPFAVLVIVALLVEGWMSLPPQRPTENRKTKNGITHQNTPAHQVTVSEKAKKSLGPLSAMADSTVLQEAT
jgi:hypothetical protein